MTGRLKCKKYAARENQGAGLLGGENNGIRAMKKIRIGVLGCGRHAWIGHFPWYAQNKRAEIIAVYSRTEAHARKAAKRWKVKDRYTGYKKVLERDDIDAVSITTPVWLHKEMVIESAKSGKHILCEKPMALSSKEAKEMIEVANENKVILMLGFCHRFYQLNAKVKKFIGEKKLGKIIMFHNRFNLDVNYENTWFAQKGEAGGGVIMDCGIHSVDLFRWLIGEVDSVSAFMNTFVQKVVVEDTGIILLKSKGGVLGVIELSWSTPSSVNTVEIYGSKGTAVVDYSKNELRYRIKKGRWITVKNNQPYEKQVFKLEIDHFIDSIIKKKQPAVNGHDGLKSLKIIEAVYRSVKEKRCIK